MNLTKQNTDTCGAALLEGCQHVKHNVENAFSQLLKLTPSCFEPEKMLKQVKFRKTLACPLARRTRFLSFSPLVVPKKNNFLCAFVAGYSYWHLARWASSFLTGFQI